MFFELKESLFCLHSELEKFIFGGPNGPIENTDYHIVIELADAPDDILIALTCIFMANCKYKNLFIDENAEQKERDIGT